jgi:hypothetical protein
MDKGGRLGGIQKLFKGKKLETNQYGIKKQLSPGKDSTKYKQ